MENREPELKVNKSNKFPILGVTIAFILALVITYFKTDIKETKIPVEAYRVYLKGESIGLINSETELYAYINEKQQSLKEKYNVQNVYIPNDINVVKDITYEENIETISDIYEEMNDKSPFTIKGYIVTIDKTNAEEYVNDENGEQKENEDEDEKTKKIVKINVLDKDIYYEAAKKVLLSFVTEEEYNNYENETQKPIVDTGEIIENLYIDAYTTFTEGYLPVNEKIYTTEEELTEYLLFGDNGEMSTYTVQDGDTLENVASKNKMNINELLIANPSLGSANALLYTGQKLTVGILDPVFSTIEEKHKVEDQTINYKTEYIYDNSKMVGYQAVQTQGVNGVTRVTQKIKSINGEISTALISNTEVIRPVINEVIVKGGKQAPIVSAGNWGWPSNIPYIISSGWGWRWGRMHYGIDISGTGYGSPIYAAKDGIVTEVKYHYNLGNYVEIDHQNGYYTRYLHMASLSRYVKVGDYVKMGQTIGDVGNSGASQGTHLHFEIWPGKPYSNGIMSMNPLLFY